VFYLVEKVVASGNGFECMFNYVINLARSPERLEIFTTRALECGLSFERIAAIDALNMTCTEFAAWHSKCQICKPMTPGEVACLLSHRKAWERIVADQARWSFIAEDDIVFSRDAGQLLSSPDWLPASLHVIKAETAFTKIEMSGEVLARKDSHVVRRLKSNHNGSAGYFVSQEGARRLIAYTENHCEPVDRILFHPRHAASRNIRIGQLESALCIQDHHFLPSEIRRDAVNTIGVVPRIENRKTKRPKRTIPSRIVREIGRASRRARHAVVVGSRISVFREVGINHKE
jgi:glycosyl transferase, family 25